MQWLLTAIGVLLAGGCLSFFAAPAARLSTRIGSWSAVGGAILGVIGVISAATSQQPAALHYAWSVPYGAFSIAIDPLSALFALVVLVLSGLAALSAGSYVEQFEEHKSVGGLFLAFNVLVASMLLVVLARNVVLFLVAWEVMSLACFFLISFFDERAEVREAGKTFLIAAHLSTAFLLVMFLLLAPSGGTLEFSELKVDPSRAAPGLLFVLALIGFGTKAGLVPLHTWLPEAYPAAPSFVSAVLSGAAAKSGIYGILRIMLILQAPAAWWGWLLVVVGALSGVLGILAALAQGNFKRLLAYSSIENMGIISMALGLGTLGISSESRALAILGFTAALFHVVNHALFKGLLFLSAGVLERTTGTCELDQLGGLLKRMPWTGAAVFVGCAAIAGLPPLNGFASEFLLYYAALGTGGLLGSSPNAIFALAVIASLALIGGLAAYTFVKAFGIGFLGEARTRPAAFAYRPQVQLVLPIMILAAGCVAAGLFAPRVAEALWPVVAQLASPVAAPAPSVVADALRPLTYVSLCGVALLVIAGGLAAVRLMLLAGREVTTSGTWGCGYSAATPRIQYTASSFARPAVEFFGALVRSRRELQPPTGLFPSRASLATYNSDMTTDLLVRPACGGIGLALSKLRWLQHGHVHLYVMYLACTLMLLMIWFTVTLAPAPDEPKVTSKFEPAAAANTFDAGSASNLGDAP